MCVVRGEETESKASFISILHKKDQVKYIFSVLLSLSLIHALCLLREAIEGWSLISSLPQSVIFFTHNFLFFIQSFIFFYIYSSLHCPSLPLSYVTLSGHDTKLLVLPTAVWCEYHGEYNITSPHVSTSAQDMNIIHIGYK